MLTEILEGQENVINVEIGNGAVMNSMLEYLYTGEWPSTYGRSDGFVFLLRLHEACDFYNVDALAKQTVYLFNVAMRTEQYWEKSQFISVIDLVYSDEFPLGISFRTRIVYTMADNFAKWITHPNPEVADAIYNVLRSVPDFGKDVASASRARQRPRTI